MAVKIKGPVSSVKKLLSGSGPVDSVTGRSNRETKAKAAIESKFNKRSAPHMQTVPTPDRKHQQWALADQPESGY